MFFSIFLFFSTAMAQDSQKKVKFYNFDDLLINGEYKKPQILYTDSKRKVKFEKLLKLRKNFLQKLRETEKDPVLK